MNHTLTFPEFFFISVEKKPQKTKTFSVSVHYVHDPHWPFCLHTACKFIVLLPVCCQVQHEPITAKASRLSVTLHFLSTLFFLGTSGSSSLLAVQSPDVYI